MCAVRDQEDQELHARPAPSGLQLTSVTPARVQSRSAHVEMNPLAPIRGRAVASLNRLRRPSQTPDSLRATNSARGHATQQA